MKLNKKLVAIVEFKHKLNKTIIAKIKYYYKDIIYKKYIKKYRKLLVHDENNTSNVGDLILIKKISKISCKKDWIVSYILKKRKV